MPDKLTSQKANTGLLLLLPAISGSGLFSAATDSTAAGHITCLLIGVASWEFRTLPQDGRGSHLRSTVPARAAFGFNLPSQKNLVVLPFTALGGGSDEQVYCDGFTETVTAKLARDPSLQVPSAIEIRAKNVTSIDKARTQFGANLVLVASWQRVQHSARINLSLIDTKTGRVSWQVISAPPHPKHRVAILFISTTPFVDASGQPAKTFQWSESDDTNAGFGGGKIATQGTHEYCVAVFDGITPKLYVDDPKIIVGGTFDAKGEIVEAEGELKEVKERIQFIENTLRKAIEKL